MTTTLMLEMLMTASELARYLRVNRRTLYRMLKHGQLPGIRMGGTWRFQKSDIDDWLLKLTQERASNGEGQLP